MTAFGAWLSINGVIILLLVATCGANQSAHDDALQYVNWLEEQVKTIAQLAVENDQQACELLKTCENDCSRHQCTLPFRRDIDNLSCIGVPHNNECNVSGSNFACQSMQVSLNRSYVRLPPLSDQDIQNLNWTPPQYISSTVCAQRKLDPLFQRIWSNPQYKKAWVYFGSAEGVQRTFPGRDMSFNDCVSFDPRKRPWYIATTSIVKDIVVLIDNGNSMNERFTVKYDKQKYYLANEITLNLLDTLSLNDRITGFLFNSNNATQIFQATITRQDMDLTATKLLISESRTINTQGLSNLSLAISKTSGTFNKNSGLKIIIVFTDVNVIGEDSIQPLDRNTILFIFILGLNPDDGSNSLSSSPFNSSIFRINDGDLLQNPLWAIRSYFDVMAQLQFNVTGGKPSWVPAFPDKDGLGPILTVAYPAFENFTRLIGVAGIDIIKNEVSTEFDDIISQRPGSILSNAPSKLIYQAPMPGINQCGTQFSNMNGFCKGEQSYNFLDYFCCGENCIANHSRSLSRNFNKEIIIILICSGVALLAFIICIGCILKKVREKLISTQDLHQEQNQTLQSLHPIDEWASQL